MLDGYQRTFVKATLELDVDPSKIWMPKKTTASSALSSFPDVEVPDLSYVKFVLASEHENSNADYFTRSELINAYKSPRHKPFNVEHTISESASYITSPLFNQSTNTIIGHIVGSALATKDGTILTPKEVATLDATDDPKRPHAESLDLLASAVLYKFYFPRTVADIEKMAPDGKMSVSMEAWFKHFDFMVDGEVVTKTDDNEEELTNAWHTKQSVGGRRVSRVLRNVLFGGVAGTENPANVESVFLTASANTELKRLQKRHAELHVLYDANPSEEYEKEHEEITQAAASLIEKIEKAC